MFKTLLVLLGVMVLCGASGLDANAKTIEDKTILLVCTSNGCEAPKRGREDLDTTHFGFTKPKAKLLLQEVRMLRRVSNVQNEAFKLKLELKDREIEIHERTIAQASKTIEAQGKQIVNLESERTALQKSNEAKTIEIAKLNAKVSRMFVIGFCIGGGVVIAGAIAVGVAFAVK